jgi:hypothetical protein
MQVRRKTDRWLQLEPMEGRIVLSTSYVAGTAVHAAMVEGHIYLDLHGSSRGTFSHARPFPPSDLGVTDMLKGRARLDHLGTFKLMGSLKGTGFIVHGNATGNLALKNSRGSVTLDLTGPPEDGFQPPESGTYTFAVKSGTGEFARAIGTGKVDLVLGTCTFTMTFHGDPNRF